MRSRAWSLATSLVGGRGSASEHLMSSRSKIYVAIADDHTVVREALRLLIDLQSDMVVVGEAADGDEVIAMVERCQPDVLIVDVLMPRMDGVQVVRDLSSRAGKPAMLVLTGCDDVASVRSMERAGASGYVLKGSSTDLLLRAIRTVATGDRFIDAQLYMHAKASPAGAQSLPTDRERAVLGLIALGYTIKEVASELGVSVKTVECDKTRVMRLLRLRNRVEAVRWANAQGWSRVGPVGPRRQPGSDR